MARPVILLTSTGDDKGGLSVLRYNYTESVERAGGLPLVLPHHATEDTAAEYIRNCDGIIFTGGGDVAPSYYGETPKKECGEPDERRDALETVLFREAYERKLPILGICRGMQFINVMMGGTLIQDIPTEEGINYLWHRQTTPGTEPSHAVRIEEHSLLGELSRHSFEMVNSFHHQAVKRLGGGLRITASAQDGITEGFESTEGRFILGVQWHPEHMSGFDDFSLGIFRLLVDESGL